MKPTVSFYLRTCCYLLLPTPRILSVTDLPSSCVCDMVTIFQAVSRGSRCRTRAGGGCVYQPARKSRFCSPLCVQHTRPDGSPRVGDRGSCNLPVAPKPAWKACYLRKQLWTASPCWPLATAVASPTTLARQAAIEELVSCEGLPAPVTSFPLPRVSSSLLAFRDVPALFPS